MSSFSARLLKAQARRNQIITTDISDIIEETKRCLDFNNDQLSLKSVSKKSQNKKTNDQTFDCSEQETHIPKIISWWEENQEDIFENKNDHDDMLITADKTLKNIVDGALNLMSTHSKSKVQKQIKTFIDQKKFKRTRQSIQSKNINSELIVESLTNNNLVTPINPTNLGHQLLEKIGWTPGSGLGLNQDGIKSPIEINIRNHRQGLGYEKSIDHYK